MKMQTSRTAREGRERGSCWRKVGEGYPVPKGRVHKAIAAQAGLAPSRAWAASRVLELRLYW